MKGLSDIPGAGGLKGPGPPHKEEYPDWLTDYCGICKSNNELVKNDLHCGFSVCWECYGSKIWSDHCDECHV